METILLCIINLLSFVIGTKIGYKLSNGKDININPVKIIKEDMQKSTEAKKEDLEKRKAITMLDNLDKYDGTGLGQTEIPND